MASRVVYYSWKGHTEKVATALAKLLGVGTGHNRRRTANAASGGKQ